MQDSPFSMAAADLGLGDVLGQQVASETEETRKKRMAQMREREMLGPAGRLAVTSIFGGGGMPGANV